MAILVDLKTIAPFTTIAFAALAVYLRKKRGASVGYLSCLTVFYVYLLYVVKYTMFPLRLFDSGFTEFMKSGGSTWMNSLNLVPFQGLSGQYLFSVQTFGNILLTVPFGFGLPFIVATRFKDVLLRGFWFVVSIEVVQLLINFAYGYVHRVVDVNDVLLNLCGVVAGFCILTLFSWLYRMVVKQTDHVDGVWEHFHSVVMKH